MLYTIYYILYTIYYILYTILHYTTLYYTILYYTIALGGAICLSPTRKGTNAVSTNGVTAICMFFDRGTFWVLPLSHFYIPKRARAHLFPQSVKQIITFAAAPLVLATFVRNQPTVGFQTSRFKHYSRPWVFELLHAYVS